MGISFLSVRRAESTSTVLHAHKNYGGILIVWDRVFGTFQEESHTPKYGLTTPVGTYNLVRLQYHEYGNMVRDVRGADRFRDKLGYVFAPPGWQPAERCPEQCREPSRPAPRKQAA
ncbi:sterol desaturase family protein [Streptomyces sp. NA04227]|uniref:sterol desaturase family protein n=1 Tax=Streptomyces sp. NA04227 TaxID=2742136 RepID=UPI0020CA90F4|nr:hypothetical protein [Streptomyces sp. NA04227]